MRRIVHRGLCAGVCAGLSRRTVLRGVGATVALPLLDAMVPALSAMARTPANPVRRLACIYIPNGAYHAQWNPKGIGTDFTFSKTLQPLEPFRDRVVVVTNLAHRNLESQGVWWAVFYTAN